MQEIGCANNRSFLIKGTQILCKNLSCILETKINLHHNGGDCLTQKCYQFLLNKLLKIGTTLNRILIFVKYSPNYEQSIKNMTILYVSYYGVYFGK